MSRFTKVLIAILAAACGTLGIIWRQSVSSVREVVLGDWRSAYDSLEPSPLRLNHDGTYVFKTTKGFWHMDGEEIVLESFSESYDERLKLSEDGKTLTDGFIDGTTFVR